MFRRSALVLALAVFSLSCGGDSPSSPSPVPTPVPAPVPAPPPPPVSVSLTGSVTYTGTSVRLSGVTVRILDGANAGRSVTTDAQGAYRFDNLTFDNGNVSATASGFEDARKGTLIDGKNTLDFTIRTLQPWEKHTGGDDVFGKPTWVTTVRIHAFYSGYSSNFILWCDAPSRSLIVNELLGTGWRTTTYDGVRPTPSCTTMHTESSSGVQWQVSEVR